MLQRGLPAGGRRGVGDGAQGILQTHISKDEMWDTRLLTAFALVNLYQHRKRSAPLGA